MEINQFIRLAIRRSGDPAIRRSGDPAIRRSGDPAGSSLLDPGEVPEGSGEPPGGGRRETSSNHAGNGKVEKIVEMRYLTPLDDTPEDVLSTIGHEIGHVLADYGHPDDASSPGKAPLLGTDRTVRLMCSGLNRDRQKGKLLVKAEWDEAEKWLSRRPNGDN